MSSRFTLGQLGWRPFFSQQLKLDEHATRSPARVTRVHAKTLDTVAPSGPLQVTLPGALVEAGLSETVAVGDWALIDSAKARLVRILERQSAVSRLAAGERTRQQFIAANIDTLFVVTSCNDDFNVARLERYLALAFDARIEPVVVLTKADLCADVHEFLDTLRDAAPRVVAVAVNATSREEVHPLDPWLTSGQTVAFVGSSGVGKSTLVNTLLGADVQWTSGIREHDAKGRHATTSRQMLPLPSGAWVIDTPGMRELKIGAAHSGVRAAFDDIEALAESCRFRDCVHEREVGCAVLAAIEAGSLDERRLQSFKKLQREADNAARTLSERRERERQFGRLCKAVMERKRRTRDP